MILYFAIDALTPDPDLQHYHAKPIAPTGKPSIQHFCVAAERGLKQNNSNYTSLELEESRWEK